jgi:hypothetical protein
MKRLFGSKATLEGVEFCDSCGSVCTPECFSAATAEHTRLWSLQQTGVR